MQESMPLYVYMMAIAVFSVFICNLLNVFMKPIDTDVSRRIKEDKVVKFDADLAAKIETALTDVYRWGVHYQNATFPGGPGNLELIEIEKHVHVVNRLLMLWYNTCKYAYDSPSARGDVFGYAFWTPPN